MKRLGLILWILGFVACADIVLAEETETKKLEAIGNTARRETNQVLNRTMSKKCAKYDLKCISDKSKKRVLEVKDAAVDGAKNLKNKVD